MLFSQYVSCIPLKSWNISINFGIVIYHIFSPLQQESSKIQELLLFMWYEVHKKKINEIKLNKNLPMWHHTKMFDEDNEYDDNDYNDDDGGGHFY